MVQTWALLGVEHRGPLYVHVPVRVRAHLRVRACVLARVCLYVFSFSLVCSRSEHPKQDDTKDAAVEH